MQPVFLVTYWVKVCRQELVHHVELVNFVLHFRDRVALVIVIELRIEWGDVVLLLDKLGRSASVNNHVEGLGASSLAIAPNFEILCIGAQPVGIAKCVLKKLLVIFVLDNIAVNLRAWNRWNPSDIGIELFIDLHSLKLDSQVLRNLAIIKFALVSENASNSLRPGV